MQRITVTFTIFLVILFAIEASAQPMPVGNAPSGVPSQPKAKPTIAVTTFENLSAFPENAWVAMSFSEALTVKLKRLYERFRVVERLRVYEVIKAQGVDPEKVDTLEAAQQREVGSLIGANYLILGSVSLQGDAEDFKTPLLANMRLVDVSTGEIKEAESIQGQMEQLFELETQLALALLKQMGIEPTPEEAEKLSLKETLSIIANKYYSLGQKAFYDGDYETAKRMYDKALETVSGVYYQAAELGLIETLKRQKAAADDAQKTQIQAEALRRREESRRLRAEANLRLFAEAQYSLLAEDYEAAIEAFGQYLDLAKPFRQLKWKQESFWYFPYPPLLGEEALYVASWNGEDTGYQLRALDPETGTVRWEFKRGDESGGVSHSSGIPFVSSIAVFDGIVVAPLHKTRLVALDARTGELRWEYTTPSPPGPEGEGPGVRFGQTGNRPYAAWPRPQVKNGLVYLKSDSGRLTALDVKTGEVRWQFETGVSGFAPPLVTDEKVYLQSKNGLVALDAQAGTLLWERPLPTLPLAGVEVIDKAGIEQGLAEMREEMRGQLEQALAQAKENAQLRGQLEGLLQGQLAKEMPMEQARARAKEILYSEQGFERLLQAYLSYSQFGLEEQLPPWIPLDRESGVWVTNDDEITGLRGGDLILEVDGMRIQGVDQFAEVLRKTNPDQLLRTLKIVRSGVEQTLQVETPEEARKEPSLALAIQGEGLSVGNTHNRTLYALSATTGEVLWQFHNLLMRNVDEIRVDAGRIYVFSGYGSTYPGYGRFRALGQFSVGTVFVLSDTGKLLWKATQGGPPLLANGVLYMELLRGTTAIDGKMVGESGVAVGALSAATGELFWQVPITEDVDPVYVTETTVYCARGTGSQKLHAFDAKTGEALWQLPLRVDYFIGEKGVLVFGTPNQLFALSPKPSGLLPEGEAYTSLLGIGTAQVALGRYEAALPPLKEALELRKDLAEAHWQLALASEGLGGWKPATESLDHYLNLVPYENASLDVKRHLWERQGIRWWMSQWSRYLLATDKRLFIGPYPFDPRTGTKRWKNAEIYNVRVRAVTEGRVYYLTDEGSSPTFVTCLSVETGEHLWQRGSSNERQTMSGYAEWAQTFAIAKGLVYVELVAQVEVSSSSKERQYRVTSTLYALDALTGETRWKFSVDRGIHSGWGDWPYRRGTPLAVVEDAHKGLCYWGVEGRLYALDPVTGAVQWQFADPDASSKLFSDEMSLAVSEGIVCIGTTETLYGLDAQTGKLKWQAPIWGLFPRRPIRISNGRVYALAYDYTPSFPKGDSWGGTWLGEWTGYLYAIRTEGGEVDWLLKIPFSPWVDYGIDYLLDDEVIYLKLYDALYALSKETGEMRWQLPSSVYIDQWLIRGEKTVYVMGDRLYALDKATGGVKWLHEGFHGNWGTSDLKPEGYGVESDGFLYLNSSGGVLSAFDLAQIEHLLAAGVRWGTESTERREVPPLERMTQRPAPFPRETNWLVIGPFDNTENKGLTVAYPPENEIDFSATYQGKTGAVQWAGAYDRRMDGRLDFTAMFTPSEWGVAYALIDVVSPEDRQAQLRIGSDDGVKVWLNGAVVWTNQVPRGLMVDEDVVLIALKQRTNRLLFKVDQGVGDWGLCVRITDEKGQPFEDLHYSNAH